MDNSGSAYIRIPTEVLNDIKKNTVPICFHCGKHYAIDKKYCDEDHNTWMPDCECLSKSTIRVVTGPSS